MALIVVLLIDAGNIHKPIFQRLAEGFAFLMPYYEYLLELMPAEGQEE